MITSSLKTNLNSKSATDSHLNVTQLSNVLGNTALSPTTTQKPVIFLSNAEHSRYFRGGDADFMDGIHRALIDLEYTCLRVMDEPLTDQIMHSVVPPADPHNFFIMNPPLCTAQQNEFEQLSDIKRKHYMREPSRAFLKEKLIETAKASPVVLYIASRMQVDAAGHVFESGSLFDEHFLQDIKIQLVNSIKIIICCLEHKYFRSSVKGLTLLEYQIRLHLQHASSIHFLNRHDQSNYYKFVENARRSMKHGMLPQLHPHKTFRKLYEHQVQNYPVLSSRTIHNLQSIPTTFISGIYTVTPLNDEQIAPGSDMSSPEHEKNIINGLCSRLCEGRKKILWFGLVRNNKGLNDYIHTLELAFLLNQHGYKLVIAGSFDADRSKKNGIFVHLINAAVFRHTNKTLYDQNDHHEILKEVKELYDKYSPQISETDTRKRNSNQKRKDKDTIIDPNESDANVYKTLKIKYPDAFPFELHINLSITALHEVALKCRYGIKYDDKGMANNASSIVACLGLYLPVLTTVGMFADNDFKGADHSKKEGKYDGIHKKTILALKKSYQEDPDNPSELNKFAIVPKNPSNDEILQQLENDNDTAYRERIEALRVLNTGPSVGTLSIFHPKTAALKIEHDIQYLPARRPS